MKTLSFRKTDAGYVSEMFGGGVAVQVSVDAAKTVRVGVETSIDPNKGWCNYRSVMLETETTVFSITDYAEDQKFRLKALTLVSAITSDIVNNGGGASSAEVQALSERVSDLEDGQEPLVLAVNSETGDLEQTGVSSGEFGLDEDGNLTFEENN